MAEGGTPVSDHRDRARNRLAMLAGDFAPLVGVDVVEAHIAFAMKKPLQIRVTSFT
jgi:hypothetical protein